MANNIRLLWVKEGFEPLHSNLQGESHQSLPQAVAAALAGEGNAKARRELPWIRAGSGDGPALFNIHEIRLLNEMYEAGRSAAPRK